MHCVFAWLGDGRWSATPRERRAENNNVHFSVSIMTKYVIVPRFGIFHQFSHFVFVIDIFACVEKRSHNDETLPQIFHRVETVGPCSLQQQHNTYSGTTMKSP